jgi:hypothetical protein
MTTVIPTEVGFNRIAAVFLKGHCQLMAKGMSHSRISKTEVLRKAGLITGKTYKRGQHAQAAEDLKAMLDADKANG